MRRQRLRMAFQLWPKGGGQRIEQRRVIEVVGLGGELKPVRIKQPQACQVRPGVAGFLDLRDIGRMGGLVEGSSRRCGWRGQRRPAQKNR
jgi:hypothetical protein